MRLEDVLLYLSVDLDSIAGDPSAFCRDAIAGGTDMIQLRGSAVDDSDANAVAPILEACRREDALLVLEDNAEFCVSIGADGVHISKPEAELGLARAVVGMDRMVGLSTRTRDDAILALEVGVDYLAHLDGIGCVGTFGGLQGTASIPLFAGELGGTPGAEAIVDAGILRLCVDSSDLEENAVDEQMAKYSRLLGRCI